MELVPGPPDFLGLGVARSGTAWWYGLLARHPQFHPAAGSSKVQSLDRFFDHDPDDVEMADLHACFARPPGTFTGEWSPSYLFDVWLGSVVRRVAPAAKLLVLLRDPVTRYESEIANMQPPLGPGADDRCFGRGCCESWLGLVASQLPSCPLLVLQYEQCMRAPEEQLARTLSFLGVSDDLGFLEPGAFTAGRSELAPTRIPLSRERRQLLIDAYRPQVDALVARHPEIDPTLWATHR